MGLAPALVAAVPREGDSCFDCCSPNRSAVHGRGLFRALRPLQSSCLGSGLDLRPNLLEQLRRDRPIADLDSTAAPDRPDIGTRPGEEIILVDNDPAAFLVQSKVLSNPGRHLFAPGPLARSARRDRDDEELSTVSSLPRSQNDDHGTILDPFFASLGGFAMPQIDIGNDVSRTRRRP